MHNISKSLKTRKRVDRNREIINLFKSGKSVFDIASVYALSIRQIRNITIQYRVRKKTLKRCQISQRNREIFSQYMDGTPAPDLAKKFCLDRCHILKIVRVMIASRKGTK